MIPLAGVSPHDVAVLVGCFAVFFLVLGVFMALDRIEKLRTSKRRPGVVRRPVKRGAFAGFVAAKENNPPLAEMEVR